MKFCVYSYNCDDAGLSFNLLKKLCHDYYCIVVNTVVS